MSFAAFKRSTLLVSLTQKQNYNAVRFYSRWSHRKPSKILLPHIEPDSKTTLKKENIIDLTLTKLQKAEIKPKAKLEKLETVLPVTDVKPKKIKISKKEELLIKRQQSLNQKRVFDEENEFIYEKLNDNDGRVSTLLVKLKSKKDRQLSNQVLVEGWRLIVEGIEAKCKLNYLIFSQIEDLDKLRIFLPKTGVKLYKISYKEIQMWSNVETSPGLIGIFEKPDPEKIVTNKPLPLQLICDNIRVPGNLGAILRVAVGAGCEKVILSKGCVDPWDSKVVRSAAGAHFRLPIHSSVDWREMPALLDKNTSVFIADSNTETQAIAGSDGTILPLVPYYGIEYPTLKHITLIIGGETEGVSDESFSLAKSYNGLRLNIPMQVGVDSLNTGMAAAVVTFEIRKQLIQAWSKLRKEALGYGA